MKKTLILYTSGCGSTKKYASDIANAINGDACALKKFKWKDIDNYQIVIYGGWISNGVIKGVDDFLYKYDECLKDKDVIVFANGMSFPTDETRKELINRNYLSPYHVRFYQLRGNFDFNKLKWTQKMMIKAGIKIFERDPNATPEQKMLKNVLATPIECYDSAKIERIITVVRQIENEPIEAKTE